MSSDPNAREVVMRQVEGGHVTSFERVGSDGTRRNASVRRGYVMISYNGQPYLNLFETPDAGGFGNEAEVMNPALSLALVFAWLGEQASDIGGFRYIAHHYGVDLVTEVLDGHKRR